MNGHVRGVDGRNGRTKQQVHTDLPQLLRILVQGSWVAVEILSLSKLQRVYKNTRDTPLSLQLGPTY
jgi:hypothetical protein